MQHIDPPPEPAWLKGDKTRAERDDVLAFYAIAANRTEKYPKDFKAYKNDEIRTTLDAAFFGKCAYCESPYKGTQPLDVEHYRPKGQVVIQGSRKPPGYYWLASDWMNLLPSCSDCNRPRAQDFPGGKPVTAGKANQFPVRSETKRAVGPGEEKRERRLLLHPYLDRPDDHLRFVGEGTDFRDGEVAPRARGRSGRPSELGKASIEVYALQRRGLVELRQKRVRELIAHLERVKGLRDNARRHPTDTAALDLFKKAVADIAFFVAPAEPYSAMCRQIVADFGAAMFQR